MALADGSKDSPVAVMENWRHRVMNEQTSRKNWHSAWGFLAESGKRAISSRDVYDKEKRAQFSSTLSLNLTEEARKAIAAEQNGVSLDSFVKGYIKKSTRPRDRSAPTDLYKQPVVTSMDYGWGKSVETFGKLALHLR